MDILGCLVILRTLGFKGIKLICESPYYSLVIYSLMIAHLKICVTRYIYIVFSLNLGLGTIQLLHKRVMGEKLTFAYQNGGEVQGENADMLI